jgi:hypothetical protein
MHKKSRDFQQEIESDAGILQQQQQKIRKTRRKYCKLFILYVLQIMCPVKTEHRKGKVSVSQMDEQNKTPCLSIYLSIYL